MCEKPLLVIYALHGCAVCEILIHTIKNVIEENKIFYFNILFKVAVINNTDELKSLGLNIRTFPTLLAFYNKEVKLGWEGFAALAPDEIKCEMVEDVLLQVAALADKANENLRNENVSDASQ